MLTDDQTLKLQDYELSNNDWNIVEQLQDSLKVSVSFIISLFCSNQLTEYQIFKTVTLEFLTDTPCPATIIPPMDQMHDDLLAAAENQEYLPTLQAALCMGNKLCNKYYSLTDDSKIYHIAISMFSHIY